VTIARPALGLELKNGKPYRVTWAGSKKFYDVKALDLDLYEKHPDCQCAIQFSNGLSAIASQEVLKASNTGWNSGTEHHCKVLKCADLALLTSESLAA
jgi:hypothetical protein